ncbi:SDR family NAD(P)-dependent oxidoreductase [Thermodesulfobacteriota bacterium]
MAFHGNTALVVGGASGMGKVHVERMAAQGAKIAVWDVNEQTLKDVQKVSSHIMISKVDVTDFKGVQDAYAETIEKLGQIDRYIHTAAIMPGDEVMHMPAEKITQVMRVNYFGMVHCVKTVLPDMLKKDSGDVILYGSSAGETGAHRMAAYNSTKAANNMFADILYHENLKTKLRWVLVLPPAVSTPLMDQLLVEEGPKYIKDLAKKGHSSLLVTPEQVVDKVEKCIEKGKFRCYVGAAGMSNVMGRLAPNLIWKMIAKLNGY